MFWALCSHGSVSKWIHWKSFSSFLPLHRNPKVIGVVTTRKRKWFECFPLLRDLCFQQHVCTYTADLSFHKSAIKAHCRLLFTNSNLWEKTKPELPELRSSKKIGSGAIKNQVIYLLCYIFVFLESRILKHFQCSSHALNKETSIL